MPSNYKTRKYTQWLEKRSCPMGASCKFAHGNEDLRLPERPFRTISNPKCKTKICKAFEPGASGLYAYAERYGSAGKRIMGYCRLVDDRRDIKEQNEDVSSFHLFAPTLQLLH
ncbi:hypothetical protein PFISCL1PPCAC_18222, partial [Pristionchus fissidentatus]